MKFENVQNKLSSHPDLHAFLVLERALPKPKHSRDMIDNAGHDEIFLYPKVVDLEVYLTEEDVIDLIRCGVMFDEHEECLTMFA